MGIFMASPRPLQVFKKEDTCNQFGNGPFTAFVKWLGLFRQLVLLKAVAVSRFYETFEKLSPPNGLFLNLYNPENEWTGLS